MPRDLENRRQYHTRYMRERYATDPVFREKQKSRVRVAKAIKRGTLVRQPCRVCGSTEKVEAHHDDYSHPLDVVRFCRKCHELRHGGPGCHRP